MVDALFPPGEGERFGELLAHVIGESRRVRPRPIYCAVREYLIDSSEELLRRGFVEIGEQDLLIRYTTAAIRAPAPDLLHFPVELRPAIPRRVPTFLEGQPVDGTI
jgi:hypothetical protein